MKLAFIILFLLLPRISPTVLASDNSEDEGTFDVFELIMGHISDSHQWHVLDYTNRHGQEIHLSVPLPVILWHDGEPWFYSSDDFYHSEDPAPLGDDYVILKDETFYITNQYGTLENNESGEIVNPAPLDFSITQHAGSMILSALIIIMLFMTAAKGYAQYGMAPPKGIRSVLEPIILFIRDDIARGQIRRDKADKFVPFLLTLFFFIWINNLIGLVPFFPGGSNLSGNISFTGTMAIFAFFAINVFASKSYWKHIFIAPGMPFMVKIFLVPVEFVGMFTKPFALMIRLFANITAGHIIILSLVSIIFIIQSIYIAPASVLLSLVMLMLELLVALLQAYIFTLLTALFIGISTSSEEH
ncbi:MAG: F0F1 ATP synthase subunit A [Marinilabiliaceae bacterium]